jgi:hypothetical protein
MQNVSATPTAPSHIGLELKTIEAACNKAFLNDREAEITKLSAVLLRAIALCSQEHDLKKISKDVREFFVKQHHVAPKDAYPRAQAVVWAFEVQGDALRMVYAEARRLHNSDNHALAAMIEHTEEVLKQYANTNGRGKVTGLWFDAKLLPLLAPEYRGKTWDDMQAHKAQADALKKAAKEVAKELEAQGNALLDDFPAIDEPQGESITVVRTMDGFPLADYIRAALENYTTSTEARLQLDAVRGLFGATDNEAMAALPVVFEDFQELLAVLPSKCNPLVKVA